MKLNNILKNTSGNVALMFSLAAVPILISVGVGVDMLSLNNANTILQAATDSAALAAVSGKKNSLSDHKIEQLVKDYLAINDADKTISSVKVTDFGLDKETGIYHVKMTGKINTSLMALAGYKTMDVGAMSEVDPGTVPTLEMALVLDVTGSMNAEGRLDALKVAAKNMVSEILTKKPPSADVKIGIVPFARYVTVGTNSVGENWLNVPPMPKTWSCWDTYPNATTSNCRQVANGPIDGVPQIGTHQECDVNYGAAVQQCNWVQSQWLGVVGSRTDGLDTKLYNNGAQYPALLDTWGPQKITDLTGDKLILDNDINSLAAADETYIPSGLLWGWELLDSGKPFTVAKQTAAMKKLNGLKALVLMTDGDNTVSSTYPYHWGNDSATADQKTAELCESIKKSDVTIFTVAFKVQKASSISMLNSCASSPGQAFDASDNQALLDAFGKIAQSLSSMRLSK
jgi:Flp pilus assembly protein TadG